MWGEFIQTSYYGRGQVKTWVSLKQAVSRSGLKCGERGRPAKTIEREYSLPKPIMGRWKLISVTGLTVF